MSLRLTIIRTITMVLAVTLVLGSVLTYWAAMRKVETEIDAAMTIAEKTVRQAVKEIAHADDARLELVRLVRVFDGNRHVRASFLDANAGGERISSFVAPAEELPDWFFNLLRNAAQGRSRGAAGRARPAWDDRARSRSAGRGGGGLGRSHAQTHDPHGFLRARVVARLFHAGPGARALGAAYGRVRARRRGRL